MRSPKPYTNEAFTKRVDHVAGRHRPGRTPSGVKVCGTCGAVYSGRRWTRSRTAQGPVGRSAAVGAPVSCPACTMIAEGRYGGELRLSGAFLSKHRAEIRQLISNEAERAAEDNPLARIVTWEGQRGRLTVRTTTEHLASRLGRALHKAYRGTAHYGFSHENKFAHVTWNRDA